MHHIRHPVKEKSTAGWGRCDLTQSQEESVRMEVQSLVKRERHTIMDFGGTGPQCLWTSFSILLTPGLLGGLTSHQLPLCVSMARRDARSEASAGDVVMRVLCGKRDIMM